MAKNNSYISIEDMEQVAGIKMQHVAKVSPTDTVGIYQQLVNPSVDGTFSSHLSLKVERYEDNLPPDEIFSTWRAMQWQPGSISVVDLSCSSTLSVKQAEKDLTALGLQPAGTLHKGIQRAEVFVNDWNEQVYLYYTIPLIVTPPVASIRIVGQKIPRKPPIKWPE
ncbi:hypothetical protein GCM10007863_09970 [Dyella mobilis]|nr:hypothetical protein GCM10007863_09970 [Dyella mobilis]